MLDINNFYAGVEIIKSNIERTDKKSEVDIEVPVIGLKMYAEKPFYHNRREVDKLVQLGWGLKGREINFCL